MMRVLLVDDEPLGRSALRARLCREPDLEIAGEAADGPEAVERILALRPDLLFLDVQMPEMDGFEVLRRTAHQHLPHVVFVSAHERHALRAFEVHALDYLLKPWSLERLAETLRRARAEHAARTGEPHARLRDLLEPVSAGTSAGWLTRFVVRERNRHLLLPVAEVEWVRAAENYVELHTAAGTHLMRGTLKDLANRLDPERFARIHRSLMVRRDRVREVRSLDSGDLQVLLADGTRLPMSRTYRRTWFRPEARP